MAQTLKEKLSKVATDDKVAFLIWENSSEKCDFKSLQLSKSEEEYKEWLTSSAGIDAQMIYDKHMKNYKLSILYNTMMDKAIGGDTNAAKWIESFTKSDYFNDSTDEIDDFLSGVNIPGLG